MWKGYLAIYFIFHLICWTGKIISTASFLFDGTTLSLFWSCISASSHKSIISCKSHSESSLYLQLYIQATRFSWLSIFLALVEISFIKLKVHSTSAVGGGMTAASVNILVISRCRIGYLNNIHCSSIIPRECFLSW